MALLKVQSLSVERFTGKKQPGIPLLKNISIEIKANEITALIGESGAGKTLLARTLAALLPENLIITNGTITYNGAAVTFEALKKMRGRHLFYTPQNATATLNPVLKIKNQVNERSMLSPPQLTELLRNLDFPDPERILHSYPFELSGGENQRCLLAMALAQRARVLVLDEPTASLDEARQESFMGLIRSLREQYGLTILLITHNLYMARAISDYIYIIVNGKIVESGPPDELFSSPHHEYTKEILRFS